MAKLGSEKRPVIVRVKTEERAHAITAACTMRGWQCIAGVEPDAPEDISDFERLMNPATPVRSATIGRNEPCPCGSGKKYKRCCADKEEGAEPGGFPAGRFRYEPDATHNVRGVADPLETGERLASLISDNIVPRLLPDLEILPWRRREVLAVQIHTGPGRPYYLKRDGIEGGAYVRVGSTNRRAGPELIEELRRYARGERVETVQANGPASWVVGLVGMHHVRLCGNVVLHPAAGKNICEFPTGRERAIACIEALRKVLGELYK